MNVIIKGCVRHKMVTVYVTMATEDICVQSINDYIN